MTRQAILFVLCLIFAFNTIESDEQAAVQNIPQRCIDNSVTEVSCKNVISEDSMIPHPDDCELFYYCVSLDHKPICRQCPAQLHFNPTKHICDAPERAGCVVQSQGFK